jgi:hypothetical protein
LIQVKGHGPANATKGRDRIEMSDTILAYLVSLGIIGAGVVWIVAGTIWTASALCIAIGMVTVGVGWISFMVEFRNRMH